MPITAVGLYGFQFIRLALVDPSQRHDGDQSQLHQPRIYFPIVAAEMPRPAFKLSSFSDYSAC